MVRFLAGWAAVALPLAFWLGPVLKRSREMHEQMSWKDEDESGFLDLDTPRRAETWVDVLFGWAVLIGVLVMGAYALAGSIQ